MNSAVRTDLKKFVGKFSKNLKIPSESFEDFETVKNPKVSIYFQNT